MSYLLLIFSCFKADYFSKKFIVYFRTFSVTYRHFSVSNYAYDENCFIDFRTMVAILKRSRSSRSQSPSFCASGGTDHLRKSFFLIKNCPKFFIAFLIMFVINIQIYFLFNVTKSRVMVLSIFVVPGLS